MNGIDRFKSLQLHVMSMVLFLAACGCEGGAQDRPDLVAVTGTVMFEGKALEGATVSFWAEKAPRPATGITNAEGKFSLSMFDANDGAVLGENVITITKVAASASKSSPADMTALLSDPKNLASKMAETKDAEKTEVAFQVPVQYTDRATSILKETVKAEGGNDFLLQLAK